jgi:hypothetical protein
MAGTFGKNARKQYQDWSSNINGVNQSLLSKNTFSCTLMLGFNLKAKTDFISRYAAFDRFAGMHQLFAGMCTSIYQLKRGTGQQLHIITAESINLASVVSEVVWI